VRVPHCLAREPCAIPRPPAAEQRERAHGDRQSIGWAAAPAVPQVGNPGRDALVVDRRRGVPRRVELVPHGRAALGARGQLMAARTEHSEKASDAGERSI